MKPIIKKINGWLVPLVMRYLVSGPERVAMLNRINGLVNMRSWYDIVKITDCPELLDAIAEHYRFRGDDMTLESILDALKKYKKIKSNLQAIVHSPDYTTREVKKKQPILPSVKSAEIYMSILDRPIITTDEPISGKYAETMEGVIEVVMPRENVTWKISSGLHNRKFVVFTYPNGRTVMERLEIFSYASAKLSADKTKLIIRHMK